MAGAKALRMKLNEEFLTCQICLNTYSDPVLLDCQHSFCRTCLDQCVNVVSGGLHCPVCRQRTLLPKKQGLTTLKKNFFVQSLIDTLGARRDSNASTISLICKDDKVNGTSQLGKRRHPLCDTCDDRTKAIMRCLDCSDFLCGDCHLVHCHTKFTKKHKMVTLGSLKSGKHSVEIQTRAKIFCRDHEDEICRMFCEDCKSPACHDCIQERCGQHPLIQMKDAVENAKKRSSDILKQAETELNKSRELAEKLSRIKSKRQVEKETVLRDIENQTKTVLASVKQHGKDLEEAMKSMINGHMKTLGKLEKVNKKRLSTFEEAYNGFKQEHDAVISSGGPEEILALLKAVEKIEEEMDNKETDEIDRGWLTEENLLTFRREPCCAKMESVAGITQYIGKLVCNELLIKDCGAIEEYKRKHVVVCESTSAANIAQENSTSASAGTNYCEINNVIQSALSNEVQHTQISEEVEEANKEELYAKIIPKKRKNAIKKIPLAEPLYQIMSESPSMNFRRKKYKTREFPPLLSPQSPLAAGSSNENLDSDELDDSVVFFTDDPNLSLESLDAISNDIPTYEELHAPDIPPRTIQTSVRRSRSLASLSAQICGKRSRNVPRGGNIASAPSMEMLSSADDTKSTSRPNSLIDNAILRQPMRLRSADNLYDLARTRPEVTPVQILVHTFTIHGQDCNFTSAPKIAILPNGNIVASDYKAQRLYRFGSDGTFISSFKIIASGRAMNPIGIACTKKGKIAVTCGETIRIYGQSGKTSKKFGNGFFSKCCGIAIDKKSNRMIVSDIEKSCVSIHSADGGLERIFRGGTGALLSQTETGGVTETLRLHTPYFIAVDQRNGNLLVSDWANNDVKIFDKDGNCLACITSCLVSEMCHLSSRQNFLNPAGVCCDDDGNVFIADHGHNRIAMFNNNWEFQRFVATEQNGLRSPWSIAIDGRGQLLVSEYWTKTIKSFTYDKK